MVLGKQLAAIRARETADPPRTGKRMAGMESATQLSLHCNDPVQTLPLPCTDAGNRIA